MKRSTKKGTKNTKEVVKKRNLTNDDLANKIYELGSAVAKHGDLVALGTRFEKSHNGLSKQIELVASAVADLSERADKSEANQEKLELMLKNTETNLTHKIETLGTRLDHVVYEYEKKETHQKDMQKVNKRVLAVEQKLARV